MTKPFSASSSLLARLILRWVVRNHRNKGWTNFNANPDLKKCVVIAAPHTSNWDFVHFIGAVDGLDIPLHFVGKQQLFRWPFGQAMRDLGGISVDRSQATNFVDAMIAEFAKRDEFMLGIAPEGTRGSVNKWKTGFYHIAMGAKVPLVLGMCDYKHRRVGLAGAIMPTGDYKSDMAKIAKFYLDVTPKHISQRTVDFGDA